MREGPPGVINTEVVSVMTAVGQMLGLVAAAEFQPTPSSRQRVADRALAGVVESDAERESALAVVREAPGVAHVSSELQVFQRPVR
jgi:hypothetical protein